MAPGLFQSIIEKRLLALTLLIGGPALSVHLYAGGACTSSAVCAARVCVCAMEDVAVASLVCVYALFPPLLPLSSSLYSLPGPARAAYVYIRGAVLIARGPVLPLADAARRSPPASLSRSLAPSKNYRGYSPARSVRLARG